MRRFTVREIGKIVNDGGKTYIQLKKAFIPGLREIERFSHVNIIWWFDDCDDDTFRNKLEVSSPYRRGPEIMGTFSTRTPERPNPIALTAAGMICVDHEAGTIQVDFADAKSGSPVLDLKPYEPALDRVECPVVPDWRRHWPKSLEESGEFDWKSEFNF